MTIADFGKTASVVVALMGAGFGAHAESRGALWSHDGGPGRPDCTQCHFGGTAERQSESMTLSGLPQSVEAGATYNLTLTLQTEGAKSAGFLLRADMGGAAGGSLAATGDNQEANRASLRSTAKSVGDGSVEWPVQWTAPAAISGDISFYVAINVGNDDNSPFGDQVYLSTFTIK